MKPTMLPMSTMLKAQSVYLFLCAITCAAIVPWDLAEGLTARAWMAGLSSPVLVLLSVLCWSRSVSSCKA